MRRRDLLKTLGVAAAAGITGLAAVPAARAEKTLEWTMVTAWGREMDVFWPGVERFCARVAELTENGLRITPLPAGELAGPLEVLNCVADGRAEMGHSTAYYWADQIPAAQWFSSVPFGMDKNCLNSWLYDGDGLRLWEAVYEPYGVLPLPMGDTGGQMFGWFRREIDCVDDIKGLRLRFPGLAARVLERAGAQVRLLPAQELLQAFESDQLDGVNWIGPHHDMRLGLSREEVWYYGPGWQEPTGRLETLVSKKAMQSLNPARQAALRAAAAETDLWMQARFDAVNASSLNALRQLSNVHVQVLPDSFLNRMWMLSQEVIQEQVAACPLCAEVNENYTAMWKRCETWSLFSGPGM
ncbi:MAG: TRAP transporter substrate-binding protein [Desulfovibrio sp.]|jgi:TRAP-type mannitol/chloroaromatic compound transport system substrate-binding protein